MKPALVTLAAFALALSVCAQEAAAKPTRAQVRAHPWDAGQIHINPRWNSATLSFRTLYATASNQDALAQCRHRYAGHRGSQGYIMRPMWMEQCYLEKTGKYPWQ
jgi:hypothetical protein